MVSADNFWAKSPWTAKKDWAIFLDRDGVINEERHLAWHKQDLVLLPGVTAAIKKINQQNIPAIVIHNAAVINRAIATPDQVVEANMYILSLLKREKAYLDAILFCGHHPEAFAAEYAKDCDWKKPKPGMLLAAAQKLKLDLARSYFIGDNDRDVLAGKAAGVKTIKTTSLVSVVDKILCKP